VRRRSIPRLFRASEQSALVHSEERNGQDVTPQIRPGYGTGVIRGMIPYTLGGVVDLVHAPAGVRCKVEIPSHWLI